MKMQEFCIKKQCGILMGFHIVCERGSAGSMGSMGVVRRIIIWKRRGVLEYMVFTKDGKFKSRNE